MSITLEETLKDDVTLLLEGGFVACKQLNEEAARALFDAARVLDPKNATVEIGHAFIELNKLELEAAKRFINDALEKDPKSELAQAFMGIAMAFNPETRAKARALVRSVIEKSEQEDVKNLCSITLQWIEKDFKD